MVHNLRPSTMASQGPPDAATAAIAAAPAANGAHDANGAEAESQYPAPMPLVPPGVALSPAFRRRRHAVVDFDGILGDDEVAMGGRRRRRRAGTQTQDGG